MVKEVSFSKHYVCDKDVSMQIAKYCNKHNIKKEDIILCKVDCATDGSVRQVGTLIFETKE